MKKINGGYVSLFEYLVVRNFPLARIIDSRLYPQEHSRIMHNLARQHLPLPYARRYNETPKNFFVDQLVGGLQPIVSMANDFQYTLARYKSRKDFFKDLMQPLRGIGNLLRGVTTIIASPFVFLGDMVRFAFISNSLSHFARSMKLNFIRSISWLLDGVSSIIRGATQIVATPLTWLFKIPVRSIITAKKGLPDISENEDVQRWVVQGYEAIAQPDDLKMQGIAYRLREEYLRGHMEGRFSSVSLEEEEKSFENYDNTSDVHISNIRNFTNYIELFGNPALRPYPREEKDPVDKNNEPFFYDEKKYDDDDNGAGMGF